MVISVFSEVIKICIGQQASSSTVAGFANLLYLQGQITSVRLSVNTPGSSSKTITALPKNIRIHIKTKQANEQKPTVLDKSNMLKAKVVLQV